MNCVHCGTEFTPLRSTARFCGSTCRKAANRKLCHGKSAAESLPAAPPASQNGSEAVTRRPEPENTPAATVATKPLSVTRNGFAIVPDHRWAGMYRIRRPDGSLSDMLNLMRARDTLLGRHRQGFGKSPSLNSQSRGASRSQFEGQQHLRDEENDIFQSAFDR